MATVRERVVKVISNHLLDVSEDDVKDDSDLCDLGADSLDVVEIVMFLEEEFDQEFPDDDLESGNVLKDVHSLVSYIESKVGYAEN